MHIEDDGLYARPRQVAGLDDCRFYHTMELPGVGLIPGNWDLRAGVDDYLGRVSLAGKRVMEIGPASGFLTFEMEKRGAQVVAVEVTDEKGWDFVPYEPGMMEPIYGPRHEQMRRLKNAFWFAHAAHQSQAKLWYGDVYQLPDALGRFDVAVMTAVLLHCHSPLQIVEQCARRASTLVITDMFYAELAGRAVCRLASTRANHRWDTWWHFSPDLFVEFAAVMGFTDTTVTTHVQGHKSGPQSLFTVVATRPPAQDLPSPAPA
jgi:SAM-dependent methyltransferase